MGPRWVDSIEMSINPLAIPRRRTGARRAVRRRSPGLHPEPVPAEPGKNRRLQIVLGSGGGQVDVGVGHRVEQRANQLGAADRRPALCPDVGREPIEEDDLAG